MQVLPPSSTGGPSRLFIMRPVATTLLMVAIMLAGIIGYRFLPVSALPEVDYPTIQVVTLYPGASPDVMEQPASARLGTTIAIVLEEADARALAARLGIYPSSCTAASIFSRSLSETCSGVRSARDTVMVPTPAS